MPTTMPSRKVAGTLNVVVTAAPFSVGIRMDSDRAGICETLRAGGSVYVNASNLLAGCPLRVHAQSTATVNRTIAQHLM